MQHLWTNWESRGKALEALHEMLPALGWKVATAESLTAGMIASTFANLSGSSAYLLGGIAAYSLDMKVNLLGVDRELAESCNCVSDAVAMQMALGAQERTGAECVLAVTGYAEPWLEGGVKQPFAHYAILCNGKTYQSTLTIKGAGRWSFRAYLTTVVICRFATMVKGFHEDR